MFKTNSSQLIDNSKGSVVYLQPQKLDSQDLPQPYQQNVRFAPKEATSLRFNWIPLCGTDPRFCENMARVAVASSSLSTEKNSFWASAETYLLASLFAHISTFEQPTPATLYQFIRQVDGKMAKSSEELGLDILGLLLESNNQIARDYAMSLCASREPGLIGTIMIGLISKLAWLQDEQIQQFTSTDTFTDFANLRKQETVVYWVLDQEDVKKLRPLTSLFLNSMLYQLKWPDRNSVNLPVSFFVDEVTASDIPCLETEMILFRGRNLAMQIC